MKTSVLIISAVLLISFSAYGQSEKNVPANVATAFSQKFPGASKVEWGKENDKEWEAEFKMDGKGYSANFDNSGVWKETKYEITAKEIPAAVKATLDKELAGYKVARSEVSETQEGKIFEFALSNGTEKLEAAIDASGKVLTKEPVKKEKEDEEDD
ncbi:MAG: PepSY-like domain-containing protein [Bacteroidales bacterium]